MPIVFGSTDVSSVVVVVVFAFDSGSNNRRHECDVHFAEGKDNPQTYT